MRNSRKSEQDSLYGGDNWKIQLDDFFEDSGHADCEHRYRILRLLVEDPVQESPGEGDHELHQLESNKELNPSLYTMRAIAMTEVSQLYRRYCNKHPEEIQRAEAVYISWRIKHFGYDYNDVMERSFAKRSLVTLCYRLKFKDTRVDEKLALSDDSSKSLCSSVDSQEIHHVRSLIPPEYQTNPSYNTGNSMLRSYSPTVNSDSK